MTKKYTHLFFDLDNTIWDFNSNSFEALFVALDKQKLLGLIGSYDDYFKTYSEVNDRLWELYRQGLMNKKVLSVQRFEESFAIHGTPLQSGGGIINAAYLAEMPLQTKLVEGAREVLDYLHGRYEVAIITNGFKEVQYEKIKKSALGKYFRKIFISEEIGAQKPGRKIFEYAVKSMNAPKKSSLMIGDSWVADIEGAMNFGIDQVYFNPEIDEKKIVGHFYRGYNSEIGDIIGITPYEIALRQKIKNKKGVGTAIISDLHQLMDIL